MFVIGIMFVIWIVSPPPPHPTPPPKRGEGQAPPCFLGGEGWGGVGGRGGNYLATKISSEIESDTISLLGCIYIYIYIT